MLVGFADCWFVFGYCVLWLLCCFRFVLFMLFCGFGVVCCWIGCLGWFSGLVLGFCLIRFLEFVIMIAFWDVVLVWFCSLA